MIKSYLSRYDLGIKEHINMERQGKYPLPKSKVLVKNLLGPNKVENLAHDIQEL